MVQRGQNHRCQCNCTESKEKDDGNVDGHTDEVLSSNDEDEDSEDGEDEDEYGEDEDSSLKKGSVGMLTGRVVKCQFFYTEPNHGTTFYPKKHA